MRAANFRKDLLGMDIPKARIKEENLDIFW